MNKQRLVDQFIDLVKIDSETKNELNVCDYVFNILKDLNVDVVKDDVGFEIGSNGYNIIAKIPGTLKKDSILLSSHLDTVTPGINIKPIINGDLITSDGSTILGSDDKSGVAIILEALKFIKENNLEHRDFEISFSIFEEGGIKGSNALNINLIDSKKALIFDSGGEIGTIINQAPAQKNIDFKIIGRAAHAGVNPEDGISSIVVLSDIISNMKLGRINDYTTANIGFVSGGVAKNIVMPDISVVGEARSLVNYELDFQIDHMVKTIEDISKKHAAKCEISVSSSYDAYLIPLEDDFIIEVSNCFENIDIMPIIESTGGGSDANIYNQKGIKSLNLSTGMTNVHTVDECIKISDMVKSCNFLINFLT